MVDCTLQPVPMLACNPMLAPFLMLAPVTIQATTATVVCIVMLAHVPTLSPVCALVTSAAGATPGMATTWCCEVAHPRENARPFLTRTGAPLAIPGPLPIRLPFPTGPSVTRPLFIVPGPPHGTGPSITRPLLISIGPPPLLGALSLLP